MTISNAAGWEVDKATAKRPLLTGSKGNGSDTLMQRSLLYPLRLIPRETVVPITRGPLRGGKIMGSFIHRCWLGSYEIEFQKAPGKKVKPGGVFYIPYFRAHEELNRVDNVEVLEVAVCDVCGFASFPPRQSGPRATWNGLNG